MREITRRLVDVALLVLLVCVTAAASAPAAPAPFVVENADRSVTVDHSIGRKNQYPADAWPSDSPRHRRFEFCFDLSSGASMCIPVTAADYQRYQIGERIRLHQQVGQLAVITDPRKD